MNIHPTVTITGDVKIEDGVTIGPYAVVSGPAHIRSGVWIGAGCIVGAAPEVRSFKLPPDGLGSGKGITIGTGTVLREAVQVHQGWRDVTTIGAGCYVMNQSYIAHDCNIDNGVTIAAGALLAGHVEVGSEANLGLGVAVHQFRRIGPGAMVGMSAVVTRDVPPFSMAYGNPARITGSNSVGLQRKGVDATSIKLLSEIYGTGQLNFDLSAFTSSPEIGLAIKNWVDYRPDH